jgi:hypothetical protein
VNQREYCAEALYLVSGARHKGSQGGMLLHRLCTTQQVARWQRWLSGEVMMAACSML